MSTLDMLDSENEFKIKNRIRSSETIQAIANLLRTESPFKKDKTSLLDTAGEQEVTFRLKTIEKILQNEYNVKQLVIERVELVEDIYEIELGLIYNNGAIEKGIINA